MTAVMNNSAVAGLDAESMNKGDANALESDIATMFSILGSKLGMPCDTNIVSATACELDDGVNSPCGERRRRYDSLMRSFIADRNALAEHHASLISNSTVAAESCEVVIWGASFVSCERCIVMADGPVRFCRPLVASAQASTAFVSFTGCTTTTWPALSSQESRTPALQNVDVSGSTSAMIPRQLLRRLHAYHEGALARRHISTFIPSDLALMQNISQRVWDKRLRGLHGGVAAGSIGAMPHRMSLYTQPVHEEPRTARAIDRAVRRQGGYCKLCLTPLSRQRAPFWRGFVQTWPTARFCHYMGLYYCDRCQPAVRAGVVDHGRDADELRCDRGLLAHMPRGAAVIPARLLRDWDCRPRPVCDAAYNFLLVHGDKPLLCVSAVAPTLYATVPLLQVAHALRHQLVAMRDIGVCCAAFRLRFYGDGGEDISVATTTRAGCRCEAAEAADDVVAPQMRYYFEDTELWSLADLIDIHDCCPVRLTCAARAACTAASTHMQRQEKRCGSSLSPATPSQAQQLCATAASHSLHSLLSIVEAEVSVAMHPTSCKVMHFLQKLRRQMIVHLFHCRRCLRHAVDVCRVCCPANTANAFLRTQLDDEDDDEANVAPVETASLSFITDKSRVGERTVRDYVVYRFDVLHVQVCTRCGAAYHKTCLASAAAEAGTFCVVCRQMGRTTV